MSGKRKDNKNVVLKTGESQRKDGSYSYRWTDQFGKRHDIYAKTLKELREKEKGLERDFLNGIDYSKKNITFGELYEEWIELKSIRPSTKNSYQGFYSHSIEPHLKNMKVSEINKNVLIRFFKNHIDTVTDNRGSFLQVYSIVNQVMQNAVDISIIEKNPSYLAYKQVAISLKDMGTRQALTKDEEKIFFEYLSQHDCKLEPLLKVLLNTGMRAGEISALRWADIDMDARLIHVQRTLAYKGVFYLSKPKTKNSDRFIPINDTVYNVFCELKSEGKKCKEKFEGYNDYVFITQRGTLYNVQSIDRCIDVLIDSFNETSPAKMPHFSAHVLRHTFATRLFENNVNPKIIQTLLGHSSIQITMDIYTSLTIDKMKLDFSSVEI